jgi:hypothetical protein
LITHVVGWGSRPTSARVVLLAVLGVGCSKLRGECDAVVKTANTFIGESARRPPSSDASPEQASREALENADRYDKLARDLAAIKVESAELRGDVEKYADLAVRSATSLRAAAHALKTRNFEQARQKRIELDGAAKSEGPLVARINATCGR